MAYYFAIVCVICLLANIHWTQSVSQYPKLLVVSYDGFRYDYLDRNVTNFMLNLKKNGSYADYMINAFTTKTFPNHHTIATGFYTETHGVMDAKVFVSNKTITDSPELFHYNEKILPIWTLNENAGNGRHSGAMGWPGSFYEYNATVPVFAEKFNISLPWKTRVDSIISWFLHSLTPINFGILYIEEPDFHGHAYGVNAPVMNDILKKLDFITKYLHEKLEENHLHDVNVVHLSDHGMTSVTLDRVVNITSYIDDLSYSAVSKNSIIHITPEPGNEDIIYERLVAAANSTSKFNVYKHKDVPKRLHFANNPRVGDIVVIAKNGYAFEDLYNDLQYFEKYFNFTVTNQSEFGVHGYDNNDMNMHPIFFAKGPAFVDQCKIEPFNSVDLFPLFCKILELSCPTVNGTLQSLSKCLKSTNPPPTGYDPLAIGVFCIINLVLIIGLVIFYMRKRKHMRRRNGNFTAI